jgi:hypothetical protein
MDTYYCAVQAWKIAAESVTNGYAAEMAEYREANPRPLLKDFLIAQRWERNA